MKKILFLFIITLLLTISFFCILQKSFAQSQFQLTIGGTSYEYASSMVHTTDGGYAVAGNTSSFGVGVTNVYIIKLSLSGSLQWSKTIGGINTDYASSIAQTTDGGYIAAGGTNSFGVGEYDMYIVKLASNGSLQWSKTVGGSNYESANSIIQTTDGGYAAAGYTWSFGGALYKMFIVKLTSNGTLVWSKIVGGTNFDAANCIIQTIDGGYAAAGITNSFGAGSDDIIIVKFDANASLQWSKTVGGTSDDWGNCIIHTTDGGYAVAGWTRSFGAGNKDIYIVKLLSTGSLQWSKTIGGAGEDEARSIIQTADGGYAVTGYTTSFGRGGFDFYIMKLSSSGSLQWSKTIGGIDDDESYSIIQTIDGGYIVAGCTNSIGSGNYDIYVVKLDANGNTCGNSTSPSSISGSAGTTTSPTLTVNMQNSTVTTPSPTVSTGGTVSTICVIGIKPISTEIPKSFSLYQNYPNPFNPSTKINYDIPSNVKGEMLDVKLVIYDISGKEVATLVNEQQNPGSYEVTWDASDYPSGTYFYRFNAGNFSETKKIVLIK